MKKIILIVTLMVVVFVVNAQTISHRVIQSSYSNVDPDGAGPALGTVKFRIEMMSSVDILGAGVGLGMLFQSSSLMAIPTDPAPPTPSVVRLGTLASLTNWTQGVDNREGNTVAVNAGGRLFDKRMVINFYQNAAISNLLITTSWAPIAEISYWTLSPAYPQGGYITTESGNDVPVFEFVTEGGDVLYPLESPNFNVPVPLGGSLPVLFSKFEAKCSGNGTLISWATDQESNSDYFEVERSLNGSTWKSIGRTPGAGNTSAKRNYNQLDLEAGNAMYRVKQVDRDGQTVYTNVERANCSVKNISTVIYPVPATDVLNVVIKSDVAARTQLMVFEVSGKLVRKLDANVQNGTNNFRIDLKGLPSGDYIIKSTDTNIELSKQFTIIR